MEKVEVLWSDATLDEGKMPQAEAARILPIERGNVGYLIHETDNTITITYGWLKDPLKKIDAVEHNLLIPKAMITSIRRIDDRTPGS